MIFMILPSFHLIWQKVKLDNPLLGTETLL